MATRLSTGIATATRLRLRCWGDFALVDPETGTDVRPRGRKARALLAYLALHPGKAVSREKLTALLWGDRADEQARASLRQALFELRGLSHGEQALLSVDRESVTLIQGGFETDIDRMQADNAAGRYEALLADLPDADEFLFANLDDVDPGFDDWLRVERTRQRDALAGLLADASAGALTAGRTRAARTLHARLLELSPDTVRGDAMPPDHALSAVADAVPPPRPQIERRTLIGVSSLLAASAAIGGVFWFRAEDSSLAPAPSREVRGLYDAARAIIYQRRASDYPTAANLLRRALVLDPDFAPASASLGSVIAMSDRSAAGQAEAERLVRRAITLDRRLAEAHGALGMVLGFQSAEARAAIKRAAALDGRDPQILFWLSNVLAIEGDYVGRLHALRRAAAIDPLWHRASGTAALAAWEFGYDEEASGYAERLRKIDLRRSFLCEYAIDWYRGDYSEVVRDLLAVRERLTQADAADFKLGNALLVLGHVQPARLLLHLPQPLWRVVSGAGPAPGELEPLLIAAERDERAGPLALTALRQTLKAGRAAEIVSAYDRRVGTLRVLASQDAPNATLITDGLQVGLAVRAAGREGEASRMLDRADAAVRQSASHGALPNWMHAAASGVWAAQGRKGEALTALQTAIDRGWHYAPMTPLPDMADIPSFAGLRGDPRFERLRQRLKDHLQRERRELGPMPV